MICVSAQKCWVVLIYAILQILFFRKFNKITKLHLYYVKFAADSKYVLEIVI